MGLGAVLKVACGSVRGKAKHGYRLWCVRVRLDTTAEFGLATQGKAQRVGRITCATRLPLPARRPSCTCSVSIYGALAVVVQALPYKPFRTSHLCAVRAPQAIQDTTKKLNEAGANEATRSAELLAVSAVY